jgi:excisionase family DNA binding protein
MKPNDAFMVDYFNVFTSSELFFKDNIMDHVSELLTVRETADYLRVPRSWVYARTRKGTIPVRKIGHLVRIPRFELMIWIDDQTVARSTLSGSS